MNHRLTVTRLKTVVIAAIGFGVCSVAVAAIGLGPIEVKSYLGQPLDAIIRVDGLSHAAAQKSSIRLASDEYYQSRGIKRLPSHEQLRFSLTPGGKGYLIRVQSANGVREPFVNFLLTVNAGGEEMTREYAVFLNPDPASVVGIPASTLQAKPASAEADGWGGAGAATNNKQVASIPVVPAGGTYGPVQPGETLYSIANKTRPSEAVSVNRMMNAIFRANRRAFATRNMSSLMAGYTLKIPSLNEIGAKAQPTTAKARAVPRSKSAQVSTASETAVTQSADEEEKKSGVETLSTHEKQDTTLQTSTPVASGQTQPQVSREKEESLTEVLDKVPLSTMGAIAGKLISSKLLLDDASSVESGAGSTDAVSPKLVEQQSMSRHEEDSAKVVTTIQTTEQVVSSNARREADSLGRASNEVAEKTSETPAVQISKTATVTAPPAETEESGNDLMAILIRVFGAIFAGMLLLAGLFIWFKKRGRKKEEAEAENNERLIPTSEELELDDSKVQSAVFDDYIEDADDLAAKLEEQLMSEEELEEFDGFEEFASIATPEENDFDDIELLDSLDEVDNKENIEEAEQVHERQSADFFSLDDDTVPEVDVVAEDEFDVFFTDDEKIEDDNVEISFELDDDETTPAIDEPQALDSVSDDLDMLGFGDLDLSDTLEATDKEFSTEQDDKADLFSNEVELETLSDSAEDEKSIDFDDLFDFEDSLESDKLGKEQQDEVEEAFLVDSRSEDKPASDRKVLAQTGSMALDESESMEINLDLANSFIVTGNSDRAKLWLDEVLALGTDEQKATARELLAKIKGNG